MGTPSRLSWQTKKPSLDADHVPELLEQRVEALGRGFLNPCPKTANYNRSRTAARACLQIG